MLFEETMGGRPAATVTDDVDPTQEQSNREYDGTEVDASLVPTHDPDPLATNTTHKEQPAGDDDMSFGSKHQSDEAGKSPKKSKKKKTKTKEKEVTGAKLVSSDHNDHTGTVESTGDAAAGGDAADTSVAASAMAVEVASPGSNNHKKKKRRSTKPPLAADVVVPSAASQPARHLELTIHKADKLRLTTVLHTPVVMTSFVDIDTGELLHATVGDKADGKNPPCQGTLSPCCHHLATVLHSTVG